MTIRNRLTWLFLGIVAVLLLGVLASVFGLQAHRDAARVFGSGCASGRR
ncbi:MAG: hypothetical protein WKG07_48095 [Hymenobacter sp.]